MLDAMESLRRFSETANKGIPHPTDMARFREFIIAAHLEDLDMGESDLAGRLVEDGWPEERAERLADEYDRGRDLLKDYDGELDAQARE